jgi:hypothetical protein
MTVLESLAMFGAASNTAKTFKG